MAKPTRYHDQLKLEKRRHLMRKVLFVLVITLIVCAGLIYGLFFAKLFDVREITITGGQTLNNNEIFDFVSQKIEQKVFGIKRGSNLFFLSSEKIEQELLKTYPKIDAVMAAKSYFHKLNIEVKERSSYGIWCLTKQDKCYYFDKSGVLYDSAPSTSGFLLFSVKDERRRDVKLGERAEEQSWIDSLVLARQKLTERGFQVKELVIPEDSFDEFYALESRGWKIQMSINTDLDAQIKTIADFLKQKLTPERIIQLQYVDIRIADRIYYR